MAVLFRAGLRGLQASINFCFYPAYTNSQKCCNTSVNWYTNPVRVLKTMHKVAMPLCAFTETSYKINFASVAKQRLQNLSWFRFERKAL